MAIVAIITFLVSIVTGLLSLLPDMRIDFNAENTDTFFSIVQGVSAFLPVTHVAIVLGLMFVLYSVEFLWHLLNWLIAKIPTID